MAGRCPNQVWARRERRDRPEPIGELDPYSVAVLVVCEHEAEPALCFVLQGGIILGSVVGEYRDGDAAVGPEWERALAAPPWDGPRVWHHGDLNARNPLVVRLVMIG